MGAREAFADEVLFFRSMAFDGDVVVSDEASGSLTAKLDDGTEFTVTPRNLVAPDGTRFGIDYDLGQTDDFAPMTATITVRRFDDVTRTPAEMAELAKETAQDDADTVEAGLSNARGSGIAREVSVSDELWAWLESPDDTGREDTQEIVGLLHGAPTLNLPPAADDLLGSDPVAALDRMEARILGIEQFQTDVLASQADLVRALESRGAVVTMRGWAASILHVQADRALVRELTEDLRFQRLEFEGIDEPDSNAGIATRDATQMTQFVTNNYVGERASGLGGWADMYAVVIDDCIDEDHPAWLDEASGASRLGTVWRWDSGSFRALLSSEDSASGTCHGSAVSGVLLADLTDGQDATVTDTTLRADRSGNALEAGFDFIEKDGAGFVNEASKVLDLSPDVFAFSRHTNDVRCDQDAADNAIPDSLYAADIAFAKSVGNYTHSPNDGCTINTPALTAAAMVTGFLNTGATTDLQAGDLGNLSSQGRDIHGRAVVDFVSLGRETSNLPTYNDAYQSAQNFGQSSASNPVAAGALLSLKDQLSTFTPASLYNDVGNLYASMLLMADGTLSATGCAPMATCSAPGATATHGDDLDQRWGAGRLRMRMFNADGLDAPYRARWCLRSVGQNEVATCLTNPNSSGVNQDLDTDVDRIRAAAYWFEPNLGSLEDPANIAFGFWRNGSFKYQTAGTAPSKKRLREDAPGGGKWEVRLTGWCVPANDAIYDSANPYANCVQGAERNVYVAMYWEDMDRETLDPEIQ